MISEILATNFERLSVMSPTRRQITTTQGATIRNYVRILFGLCCVIWMFVAIDHYRTDSMMFG